MHGPDSEHYINAMKMEINQLLKQKLGNKFHGLQSPMVLMESLEESSKELGYSS